MRLKGWQNTEVKKMCFSTLFEEVVNYFHHGGENFSH